MEHYKRDLEKKEKESNRIISMETRDGSITSDPTECANIINQFFIDIGGRTKGDLNASTQGMARNMETFYMFPVSQSEIIKEIGSLKNCKSSGPDGIPTKILKDNRHTLSKVLMELINYSIEKGIFPSSLKISRINPIYKEGDTKKASNYRPIAILNSLSKLFEKIIYSRLNEFISKKCNLLSCCQYAFQKGKGTRDAIEAITERINNALSHKNVYAACSIDISKAFDTVKHEILIKKT